MNQPGPGYLGYTIFSRPHMSPCEKCGGEILELSEVHSVIIFCAECGRILASRSDPTNLVKLHR